MQLDTKNNCSLNKDSLDYYDVKPEGPLQPIKPPEMPVTKVVFDESHGSLLGTSQSSENQKSAYLKTIQTLLRENKIITSSKKQDINCYPAPLLEESDNTSNRQSWSELLLDSENAPDILVLAAPTEPFKLREIGILVKFVEEGGSLLITVSRTSLDKYSRNNDDTIEQLMARFGLRFRYLLGPSSNEIVDFQPHYLSSEINSCFFQIRLI
ncbi:hypothetical protein IQ260_26510 [Leptolyngbya cf. ectocarpi LEGE 11479]|uniref:Uncharacterized protein n=1 Tax=Leptolyngbya cf. ectocarpi LEGE 11479 TaxID=1828722 RepID=A0A928ZZC2_LEPEC|nr:hypothetical protein [Leptolyngbya ectocarpi]MBE9070198.1 hypothetical protein [Leptolyngbya cf. ectocarpi LEGE 11479]